MIRFEITSARKNLLMFALCEISDAIIARETKVINPVNLPRIPKNLSVITLLFTKILMNKRNKKIIIAIGKDHLNRSRNTFP